MSARAPVVDLEIVKGVAEVTTGWLPGIVHTMRATGHYALGGELHVHLVRLDDGKGWYVLFGCRPDVLCGMVGTHEATQAHLDSFPDHDATVAWAKRQAWWLIASTTVRIPPAAPLPAQRYEH